MTFMELISTVAEAAKISKTSAETAIRATFEAVADEVAGDGRVGIPDFGSFTLYTRKPRKGRNPKTGSLIEIPSTRVLKFRASAALKEKIS